MRKFREWGISANSKKKSEEGRDNRVGGRVMNAKAVSEKIQSLSEKGAANGVYW